VLTWIELQAVLARLPVRDRLLTRYERCAPPWQIVRLAVEVFSTRSAGTQGNEVYRGKIRPFGKTKNSMRPVPLGERLAQDLWLWKQECPDASPEAFIFANARGGFMNATN
jgi:hypothetical protein